VRVECYSGYKADERPIRFYLGDREFIVRRIAAQWLSPEGTCFRVEADDGNLYVLRRSMSEESPVWDLL
jgi:hypothetical protein